MLSCACYDMRVQGTVKALWFRLGALAYEPKEPSKHDFPTEPNY